MLDFGFYNMDCMEGMKEFPDKYFDLAIVDPPYGDGGGSGQARNDSENGSTATARIPRGVARKAEVPPRHTTNGRTAESQTEHGVMRTGGTWATKYAKKSLRGTLPRNRNISKSCFASHGTRLSGGGNYFELPATRCFIIWRKLTISESFSMAMAEYAWTSFNDNAKVFEYPPQGKGDRFHPTQKPVELYKWLINKYAKDGDVILDTHTGSASSLIACRETGHKYVGFEIDPDYYRMAKERLDASEAQANIFDYL